MDADAELDPCVLRYVFVLLGDALNLPGLRVNLSEGCYASVEGWAAVANLHPKVIRQRWDFATTFISGRFDPFQGIRLVQSRDRDSLWSTMIMLELNQLLAGNQPQRFGRNELGRGDH
ncbi:hypothetical protein [Bradyrhizobium sp. AUGA SZCCT0431]|uniref:hypothetical protein n=1 Tax=Bradyrhizobium sp. AUGA SZCCT0431 TaxID=2807674 RepID=UPI001BAAA893|nr:hypothetical protein [Bradyrhizobium sp. AUGA SZCCT0431]MBR1146104.1 hypothetical protein [Bradyrhizobium sp. AUGA SZCCT0431]